MFQVAYTNIKSKIKINGLLSDLLNPMCVRQCYQLPQAVIQYCTNLINADKRNRGIQIGDHDIKIVNFTDNSTLFLGDITCLNRIQVILRLFEKKIKDIFTVLKIIFSNAKPL